MVFVPHPGPLTLTPTHQAARDNEDELEQGGQFAMPPLPEAEAAAAAARRGGAEGL